MSTLTRTFRHHVNSNINVVPMIDILLVLLIIFMLIAIWVRMTLKVQVPPPAVAEQPASQPVQIVLELLEGQGYAINGQPIPMERLDSMIRAIYAGRPRSLIFVKSASDRSYQEVIEAVDVAKGAGVETVAFMTGDGR